MPSHDLTFDILPSRRMAVMVVVIHMLSLMTVWWFMLPLWLKILLTVAIVGGFKRCWRRYVNLTAKNRVVALSGRQCRWRLTMADGVQFDTQIQNGTLVTAWLVVMQLKSIDSRRRFSVILFDDALTAEQHRQLRVELLQLDHHTSLNKAK